MNIFLKISLNEYAMVPYFQMICGFSNSAHNVAMVTIQICYFFFFFLFFFFLPFLPVLLYTDKNSNASTFDKQLYTLSTDFISEKEFLEKIFCCLLHAEVL